MTAARVGITFNGARHAVQPRPGQTLLRFLRSELGLTGTRQGCESGACGACTVLLDGVAVQSCQLSLGALDGTAVQTIEAVRDTPAGAAIVQALIDARAAQCGYCLPGIVVSATAAREADGAAADLFAALDRNICRCGTQHRILRALQDVRQTAGAADD